MAEKSKTKILEHVQNLKNAKINKNKEYLN